MERVRLTLDHLTVVAPTLAEGVAHVRDCLDIDMPYGGAHPQMGTHNHLLRLGEDRFLEVIAVDPAANPPARPRWFGLDDAAGVRRAWDEGRRLSGWVARTDDLDGALAAHGVLFGRKTQVSRGSLSWFFAVRPDGAMPAGGAVPSIIEWGVHGCPAPKMPDFGARLVNFELSHPEPAAMRVLYDRIGIVDAPSIAPGEQIAWRADIATPRGLRRLA